MNPSIRDQHAPLAPFVRSGIEPEAVDLPEELAQEARTSTSLQTVRGGLNVVIDR